MAALVDAERFECWAETMRRKDLGSVSITKGDLRAAIDAIDDWIVANASAFNTAIPQPARGALSTAQKAMLLSVVVLRRYEKGA